MLGSKAKAVLVLLVLSSRLRMTSQLHPGTMSMAFDFHHYCPFNKVCDTESKNISEIEDAECCQDCSCYLDCPLTGICCPLIDQNILEAQYFNQSDPMVQLFSNQSEYGDKTILSDTFYPCVMIHNLLNIERGLYVRGTQTTALRVITDCQSINESLEYPSCQVPETLEDFRLVVDERGLVYKNEQCAKCNGVTNTNAWSLQPTCRSLQQINNFESFDELNAYILRFCMLESYPPMTHISKFAQCFSSVTPPSGVCYDLSYVNGKTLTATSFTALLRDNTEEQPEHDDCQSYELWDSYSAVCRRLFCPPLMIPRRGKCVDMFKSYQGFVLDVLFKAVNWNDSFGQKEADSVYTGLEDTHFAGCKVCSANFELSKNNQGVEGVYLRTELSSNELCTLNAILNKLRNASHTNMDIKMNETSLHLELQFEKVYPQNWLFPSLMIDECQEAIFVTRKMLQNCPHIEVPTHIADLKVGHIIYPQDDHGGEGKQVICVHDYIDLMESQAETSGKGNNSWTMVLIVAFMLIYCM